MRNRFVLAIAALLVLAANSVRAEHAAATVQDENLVVVDQQIGEDAATARGSGSFPGGGWSAQASARLSGQGRLELTTTASSGCAGGAGFPWKGPTASAEWADALYLTPPPDLRPPVSFHGIRYCIAVEGVFGWANQGVGQFRVDGGSYNTTGTAVLSFGPYGVDASGWSSLDLLELDTVLDNQTQVRATMFFDVIGFVAYSGLPSMPSVGLSSYAGTYAPGDIAACDFKATLQSVSGLFYQGGEYPVARPLDGYSLAFDSGLVPAANVPEPGSLVLLSSLALAGLALGWRRRIGIRRERA